MTTGHKLLLIPHLPAEEVDFILDEAGFIFQNNASAAANQLEQSHYIFPDGTNLYLFVDSVTGVTVFEIHGAEIFMTLEALESTFIVLDIDETLVRAEKTILTSDRQYYLFGLGLIADQLGSGKIAAALSGFAEDKDPLIRRAAVLAMGYTGYRQFLSKLDKIAQDEDERVRDIVEVATELINKSVNRAAPINAE